MQTREVAVERKFIIDTSGWEQPADVKRAGKPLRSRLPLKQLLVAGVLLSLLGLVFGLQIHASTILPLKSVQASNTEANGVIAKSMDLALFPELDQNGAAAASGDKVVYLTFDDGPCASTERLLNVLDELDVKATFFVTGQYGTDEQVVEWIRLTKERGHVVAPHTYSHEYEAVYASLDAYLEDFKQIEKLITKGTGERTRLFRFPGGSNTGYNQKIREALLTKMTNDGYIYHDWNASNGDSEGYDDAGQVARALEECRTSGRAVLLMHNTPDKDMVIDVLPQIVNQLKAEGYRFAVLEATTEPIQFIKPGDSSAASEGETNAGTTINDSSSIRP